MSSNQIYYPKFTMTLEGAKLCFSALGSHNKKHEQEKTMTPFLKNEIISLAILLNDFINSNEQVNPELPQAVYDEFTDVEKMKIF